jgi:hypothetical protein
MSANTRIKARRRSNDAVLGAAVVAHAVRAELIQRGHREEEISLQWFSDPAVGRAPELHAEVAEIAAITQMFSREELEGSCNRPRQSVRAKIDRVVESLHAGLP